MDAASAISSCRRTVHDLRTLTRFSRLVYRKLRTVPHQKKHANPCAKGPAPLPESGNLPTHMSAFAL